MIGAIQTYLKQIIAASFMIALLQAIFPPGLFKKIGFVACGLVLILVILRPISKITLQDISQLFAKAELETVNFDEHSRENMRKMAQLISEKTQTYILDKAKDISFTPKEVLVQIREGEEYPYPHSVTITGMYTQKQRMELAEWIETNLAIPQKNQTWKWE